MLNYKPLENVGQLISLNNFTLTTTNKYIAETFSTSKNTFENDHVLFNIRANKSIINPKPFADTSDLSQFIDAKEV